MKKTFFLLAFILPVCSMLAQPPTPVMPVVSDGNDAKILSIGSENNASADQQGIDNFSRILQTNDGNSAVVQQINPKTHPSNEIVSRVYQPGARNKAFVTQVHDGTLGDLGYITARIVQSGDDNKATQLQGPGNKTGNLLAVTRQGGDLNVAKQEQHGYRNNEFIKQEGNSNVGMQLQENGVMGSNTVILQPGEGNKAYQNQTGSGTNLKALTIQEGNGNKSTQNQTGWVNNALVRQTGSTSVAQQDQVGKLNYASIKQTSGGNVAKQSQDNTGSFNAGFAEGYPAANTALILQEGGDGNIAHQTQTIHVSSAYPWDANWGRIHQEGGGNKAYQTQDGGNNLGIVNQVGIGNVAHVSQSQSIL